jgi:hypothetical protein
MKQRLSQPKKYGKESSVPDAVGWVLQVSGSAELAVQAWQLIVLHAEVLLLPHQNSAGIVVPG